MDTFFREGIVNCCIRTVFCLFVLNEGACCNLPFSYCRYWTGASCRLMQRNIKKKRLMPFPFGKTPCISLSCKLVPVRYWEYENGLFIYFFYYFVVPCCLGTCLLPPPSPHPMKRTFGQNVVWWDYQIFLSGELQQGQFDSSDMNFKGFKTITKLNE